MNIQTLLTQFHGVIKKRNNLFKNAYSRPLFDEKSLESLIKSAKNCEYNRKDRVKSYEFPDFLIKITPPTLPRNCSNPNGISNVEITLESAITYSKTNENKITDPIFSLYFIVSISSKEPQAFQSWHLDKQGATAPDSYIHPEYHITLGGNKLKEKKATGFDFGQALYFGTPRFMHPPMDFILGIDFILNHYVERNYANVFLDHPQYIKIVETMKEQLWKPYGLAFSKNYCKSLVVDGNDLDIDSNFSRPIIG